MIWEIWQKEDDDGRVVTMVRVDNNYRPQLVESGSVLVKRFEAATDTEACQALYDHYGWGEYKPMEE